MHNEKAKSRQQPYGAPSARKGVTPMGRPGCLMFHVRVSPTDLVVSQPDGEKAINRRKERKRKRKGPYTNLKPNSRPEAAADHAVLLQHSVALEPALQRC